MSTGAQRDEAFHARELAVDELRSHVARQNNALNAMRASFGEAAEALRETLRHLPLSDGSIAAELHERNRLRRRLEASRLRIALLAEARWRRRTAQAVWNGWRSLVLRGQLVRASQTLRKAEQRSVAKHRDLAAEAEVSSSRALARGGARRP